MNLLHIYSTPFWEAYYPNFETDKENLLTCVRDFRSKNPETSHQPHVSHMFQSPMTLTKEPMMSSLFDYIAQVGMKAAFDLDFVKNEIYLTAAWVNFMDSTSCIQFNHNHQDTFSGVFYLKAPKGSGSLVISNPGVNSLWQGQMLVSEKNRFTADKLNITPIEGGIFLWPSYLDHYVRPNVSDGIERISISFNIVCIPVEFVDHTR